MPDYMFTSVTTVNMRSLVLFALLSVAAAKPKPGGLLGGLGELGGWDGGYGLGHGAISISQPALTVAHAPVLQAAPVIQAAPVVHAAPVAIAGKGATSYSSFQRVIHPTVAHQVVAQPVVHAAPAVVAQPVVHAAPLTISHAPIASYGSIGSIGHGWGGW